MNQDTRRLHQLVKVGCARAGAALGGLGAPLDTLLPDDGGAVEARLWLAVGALDLWERSGFQPAPHEDSAPPPAPAERLRPSPARAQALLILLLRGVHPPGLLSEWLQLLRRHGAHLPARALPDLLEAATRQPALRATVIPVLGERGQWLARLQPEWQWAAAGADDVDDTDGTRRAHAWHTGSLAQRLSALQDWRGDDPDAARQALADVWTSEPPEHRAALLPALAVGLGHDDEDFLEAALDDRRKEVRTAAQRLLIRLPGSCLAQRMRARVLPLLQLEKRLLRAPRLQLVLPAENDAAMRRDGVGASPWPGLGEKAGWVVDMLAAVDPRTWEAAFDRPPAALLELARDSEFAAVLIRGWAQASVQHGVDRPSPWLLDVAHWWIVTGPALRDAVPDPLFDVLGAVFRHDQDGRLGTLVDAMPAAWPTDAGLLRLLRILADQGAGSWPPALSRRVLQRIEAALPSLPTLANAWAFRQLLPSLALALDPETAYGAAVRWESTFEPDSQWRSAFDTFSSTVRLRHEMRSSFQEPA